MIRHSPILVVAVALFSAPVPSLAQSTTDAVRFAVTYVEVTPGSVTQATSAFRTYRDAAGREDGFISFELFEQIGRPGHLAVIESWRDQAAFDAHQSATSLTALTGALQPMRTSGYDQRPYKPLTLAPGKGPPGRNAVVVVSHVDIGGGGKIDVPALLRRLAEASRAEPGALRFDVTQHTVRANHFTVVEIWADQQALDRHAAAPHTKQFRDEVQPVSGSPLDERVYKFIM